LQLQLRSAYIHTSAELLIARGTIDSLTRERDEIKSKLVECESIESLKRNESTSKTNTQILGLEANLVAATEQLVNVSTKYESEHADNVSMKANMALLTKEFEHQKSQSVLREKTLQDSIFTYQQTINDLQAHITKLSREREAFLSANERFQIEIVELKEKQEYYLKKLDANQHETLNIQNELVKTKEDLASKDTLLEQNQASSDEKISILTEQLTVVKANNSNAENKLNHGK
jgi:chromosome segregation ATPase